MTDDKWKMTNDQFGSAGVAARVGSSPPEFFTASEGGRHLCKGIKMTEFLGRLTGWEGARKMTLLVYRC